MDGFLPILIMLGLGAGFAGGSVLLSQFVGPSKQWHFATNENW